MRKRRSVKKLLVLRRFVQIAVVALMLLAPALARYTNYLAAFALDEKLEAWHGTVPGAALSAIDSGLRALPRGEHWRAGRLDRNAKQVLAHAQNLRGGVWSAEIAGLSMTDPLAAAESMLARRRGSRLLLIGIIVPVLVTLVVGRVFCSWVCPMGLLLELTDKLRALLRVLELRPRHYRAAATTKYFVLAAGLLAALVGSVPVLAYVYPPAILSRELHDLVFALFDRAEMGRFGVWLGSLRWGALVVLGIIAVELTLSRRWWCRTVCPGGALYALLGWARPLRVALDPAACTACAACVATCPMGLNPMKNRMGIDCDSCGVCISACNDGALAYRTSTRLESGWAAAGAGEEVRG